MTKIELEVDAHDLSMLQQMLGAEENRLQTAIEESQQADNDYSDLYSRWNATTSLSERLAKAAIEAVEREQAIEDGK